MKDNIQVVTNISDLDLPAIITLVGVDDLERILGVTADNKAYVQLTNFTWSDLPKYLTAISEFKQRTGCGWFTVSEDAWTVSTTGTFLEVGGCHCLYVATDRIQANDKEAYTVSDFWTVFRVVELHLERLQ